jgi:triosephosphate isomerase
VNPSRKPLIAGNWKMHHGGLSGLELAAQCVQIAHETRGVDLVIAPPYTALAAVAAECHESAVSVAAQNVHARDKGAFTGEVSAGMLVESGATWVIIGHSERRQISRETDEDVAEKTSAAIEAKLSPIVCVGETLEQRELGDTLRVVKLQVDAVIDILGRSFASSGSAAIAYEPVWAIGTGKNAGPAEAEEVHAAIRGWLAAKDATLAARTRILYGGSLKPDNAPSLLACPNVDGGLIGGASLDAASFGAIARAAQALSTSPS